jgi:hypothetical protein
MRTRGSLFGAGVILGLAAGLAVLCIGAASAQDTSAGALTREKLPAGTLRAT